MGCFHYKHFSEKAIKVDSCLISVLLAVTFLWGNCARNPITNFCFAVLAVIDWLRWYEKRFNNRILWRPLFFLVFFVARDIMHAWFPWGQSGVFKLAGQFRRKPVVPSGMLLVRQNTALNDILNNKLTSTRSHTSLIHSKFDKKKRKKYMNNITIWAYLLQMNLVCCNKTLCEFMVRTYCCRIIRKLHICSRESMTKSRSKK